MAKRAIPDILALTVWERFVSEAVPTGSGPVHYRFGGAVVLAPAGAIEYNNAFGKSNRIITGRTSMRLPVSAIILLFIAAALFSENLAAAAQSANPYPWCAIYYKEGGGTPRCYFDTRDQCMASISGIGGFCVQNLQYSPRVNPSAHRPRS
jgi:Protein of unknown function (DUF3551)